MAEAFGQQGHELVTGASVQAATQVNAVQTSKRKMCGPARPSYRGRLIRLDD